MNKINVKVTVENPELVPTYGSLLAAGADLRYSGESLIVLAPGERKLIPTGIKLELPDGYEAQIRPRSGLANKNGITVLNTPGTIDADYRGEVMVNIINLGYEEFTIRPFDRIAQMVIKEVTRAEFSIVTKLNETERGEGGHGSTGVK